jgi:hypothetical protein
MSTDQEAPSATPRTDQARVVSGGEPQARADPSVWRVAAQRPPVWLLDVDGVLNAVTRTPDWSLWDDWRRGTATADGTAWPIWFSPTVVATVRRLHESGLVEARWLTTWGAYANVELRELLGMPPLGVESDVLAEPGESISPGVPEAEAGTSHGEAAAATAQAGDLPWTWPGEWWKLRVVRRVVARDPGRSLIWSDDDLRTQGAAVRWVRANVARRLLLAPDPHLGLTPRMLRAAEQFCREQAAR